MSDKPYPATDCSTLSVSIQSCSPRINSEILESYDFDLGAALSADPSSCLQQGGDFRHIDDLRPVLNGHPMWTRITETLRYGTRYPLLPLEESDRLQDLSDALAYGNHKSAQKNSPVLMESMRNEVQRGWQLPIQLATLPMLPHAVIGPLGCADQMKLTADGSRKPSKRTTHDMSYKFSSQQPVNERVLEQALSPCIYGFAMRRLIHMIVALREEHGDQVSLYLSKSDLKSAYRRVQASPSLALQSITTTKGLLAEDETFAPKEDIALIALRLTFGGAPNPAFFSEISETITDTANMLSACRSWNQLSLCPQHRGLLGEPMKVDDALTSKVPFARARPMCVPVATPLTGGAECFIDDIFSVVPELPDQGIRADRMALATFLAIEVFGRPPTDHDPMPRDDLLALSKALAEGTPTETLIVTGWLLDTRRLLISLPDDKFQAWGGVTSTASSKNPAGGAPPKS